MDRDILIMASVPIVLFFLFMLFLLVLAKQENETEARDESERNMPKQGRSKKAKPRHIYDAYPDIPPFGSPSPTESFADYLKRLKGPRSDPLMVLLIELGYEEPSQREYLLRLDDVTESLYKLREKLYKAWPK